MNTSSSVLVQERVTEFLLSAGVDASEMDPLSLETLCELFATTTTTTTTAINTTSPAADEPVSSSVSISTSSKNAVFGKKTPEFPQKIGLKHTLIQRRFSDLTEVAGGTGAATAGAGAGTGTGTDTDVSPPQPRPLALIVDSSDTAATTAGGSFPSLSLEERLWKRMEEQSRLILDLQHRINELTLIVQNIQQGGGGLGGGAGGAVGTVVPRRQPQLQPQQQPTQQQTRALAPQPFQQQPPARQQPPLLAPNNNINNNNLVVLPFLGSLVQWFLDIPTRIRTSRLYKIVALFFELRRRQIPDLNLALLFKILILLTILMARLSSSRAFREYQQQYQQQHHQQQQQQRNLANNKDTNDGDDDDEDTSSTASSSISSITDVTAFLWIYRLYFLVVLIVTGFLIHSGYAHFLYNFFVKEDYPGRIWNGEEINVDEEVRRREQQEEQRQQRPMPEAPRRRRRPQRQQAGEGRWWDAILGGHIPRRVVQQPQDDPLQQQQQHVEDTWPAPIRAVIEVAILLGSFVLSIFPMWQPQAAALPHAPRQQEQQPNEHNENDNDEGDEDHHPNDDANNNGLPRVRPPQDPAEYEDDSDEDRED